MLEPFTTAILTALGPVESGVVVIEAWVFPPTRLLELLSRHGLPQELPPDTAITAETAGELSALLTATFGGWIDYHFLPLPKPFVFYADHDEYTTFFAARESNLRAVADALTARGFPAVENYTRHLR